MRHLYLAASLALTPLVAIGQEAGQIIVSGTGSVSVAPDIARLSVSVTARSEDAETALGEMNEALRAVLNRLENTDIAPQDIQTSGLQLDVQQDFSSSSGRGEITGYLAQSAVNVTVRDLDRLGVIIGQAVADGANGLGALSFDVADREPHLEAARRAAIADAAAKAALFADAAGVGLGPVRQITEEGAGGGPILMEARGMSQPMDVATAPGNVTISASVSLRYDIAE